MKILVTNDDGIRAEGIRVLAEWAAGLGEVFVVAPAAQQSAKSHSINIHEPFAIRTFSGFPEPAKAWEVESTPADCVRVAVEYLKIMPDLVLSGVNYGYNVGYDIVYSATCGAVFEAACFGIPAVAVSTSHHDRFEGVAGCLDRIADYVRTHRLTERSPLLNINIAPQAGDIFLTRQGGPYIKDRFVDCGDGLIRAEGYVAYDGSCDPEIDLDVVMNGGISISPLTLARTDQALLRRLKEELGTGVLS